MSRSKERLAKRRNEITPNVLGVATSARGENRELAQISPDDEFTKIVGQIKSLQEKLAAITSAIRDRRAEEARTLKQLVVTIIHVRKNKDRLLPLRNDGSGKRIDFKSFIASLDMSFSYVSEQLQAYEVCEKLNCLDMFGEADYKVFVYLSRIPGASKSQLNAYVKKIRANKLSRNDAKSLLVQAKLEASEIDPVVNKLKNTKAAKELMSIEDPKRRNAALRQLMQVLKTKE